MGWAEQLNELYTIQVVTLQEEQGAILLGNLLLGVIIFVLAMVIAFWASGRLRKKLEQTEVGGQSLNRFLKHNVSLTILAIGCLVSLYIAGIDLSFLFTLLLLRIPLGDSEVTLISLLLNVFLFCVFIGISVVTRRLILSSVLPTMKVDKGTEFLILKLTHYLILAVGILTVLGSLGFNLTTFVAFAGLLGVGIGFGLQNLAANFVSGLILLFERPIAVGDWVQINGMEGEVKEINLRSTGMETVDNQYIIVPNQDFVTGQLLNGSKGTSYIRIHTEVGVSYSSDMNLVKETLLKVARDNAKVLDDPTPEVWIKGFGNSSVDFDLLTFIENPRMRIRTQAELYEAAWWALKEAKIEIPFPQRDLHLRSTDIPFPTPAKVHPVKDEGKAEA